MLGQSPNNSYFGETKLLVFIAEHDIVQHGIYLWSIQVSCPGCLSSQFVHIPSSLQGQSGKKTSFDVMQVLLSNS